MPLTVTNIHMCILTLNINLKEKHFYRKLKRLNLVGEVLRDERGFFLPKRKKNPIKFTFLFWKRIRIMRVLVYPCFLSKTARCNRCTELDNVGPRAWRWWCTTKNRPHLSLSLTLCNSMWKKSESGRKLKASHKRVEINQEFSVSIDCGVTVTDAQHLPLSVF